MAERQYPPAVFDAVAFIAYEGGTRARGVVEFALRRNAPVLTSSAVVAQVWHGSPRQPRLARLLRSGVIDERALDDEAARAVGVRCAQAAVPDVVVGHVAELALAHGAVVLTSDQTDLVALGVAPSRIRPV